MQEADSRIFDGKLSSDCPDSTVGEGLAIRGSDAQNEPERVQSEVNDWLSGVGYTEQKK